VLTLAACGLQEAPRTATPQQQSWPRVAPAPVAGRDTGPVPEAEHEAGRGCISDANPTFTAHFTDLSRIRLILPPAVISGNRFKNRS